MGLRTVYIEGEERALLNSWFPVDLTTPEGRYRQVKVLVGPGWAAAYNTPDARTPSLLAEIRFEGMPPNSSSAQIHYDGGTWVLSSSGGCGCGHPLRSWMPPGKQGETVLARGRSRGPYGDS